MFQGARVRREFADHSEGGVGYEGITVEDEVKVLRVDKPKLLRDLNERHGEITFDGTVTDEYFDFPEGENARERLGSYPRIRHYQTLHGQEWYEVTIKKPIGADQGGKNSEFNVKNLGSHQEAREEMEKALELLYGMSAEESSTLYAWHTLNKERTEIEVFKDGIKTTVDIDTWKSEHIVLDPLSPDQGGVITRTYNSPGATHTIDTYAEFEVLYAPPGDDPAKQAHAGACTKQRDELITDLGYEKAHLPAGPGYKEGSMSALLVHYDIPPADELRRRHRNATEKQAA